MTDQYLIARLRGYIGKASFATGADRATVFSLLDELAAAITHEVCDCGPTCEDKRDGCRYTQEPGK